MMNDVISRQAVLDIVGDLRDRMTVEGYCAMVERMKALPSAQSTLCGYDIKHLDLIARILQKEDLPPDRIVDALTDIGRIVEIVKDEYEEALRKAVEQCTI